MLSCDGESPRRLTLDGSMDTFRETLFVFAFPVKFIPPPPDDDDDDDDDVAAPCILLLFLCDDDDDEEDFDDDELSNDCHTDVLNLVSSVAT